jgi:aquaporin Z
MVLGIIMFTGKVSGAPLNPAVSIPFALRRDFRWQRVPGYIIVQLIGATLAALVLHAVINVSAVHGRTTSRGGTAPARDSGWSCF